MHAVTGQSLELAVMHLMELGYEQELVTRALNASFNNPNRAAEMLVTVSSVQFVRRSWCHFEAKSMFYSIR